VASFLERQGLLERDGEPSLCGVGSRGGRPDGSTAGQLNIGLETCCECGGAVKVIACIEDPVVIEKILTHLNEKATSAATGLLPESQAPLQAGLFD
jgi:hypothetical protein